MVILSNDQLFSSSRKINVKRSHKKIITWDVFFLKYTKCSCITFLIWYKQNKQIVNYDTKVVKFCNLPIYTWIILLS